MSLATVVSIYLGLGLLAATGMYFAIGYGVDRRAGDPEMDEVMTQAETAVGRTPGGMVTFLLMVALLWPLIIALLIRKITHRRAP